VGGLARKREKKRRWGGSPLHPLQGGSRGGACCPLALPGCLDALSGITADLEKASKGNKAVPVSVSARQRGRLSSQGGRRSVGEKWEAAHRVCAKYPSCPQAPTPFHEPRATDPTRSASFPHLWAAPSDMGRNTYLWPHLPMDVRRPCAGHVLQVEAAGHGRVAGRARSARLNPRSHDVATTQHLMHRGRVLRWWKQAAMDVSRGARDLCIVPQIT